MTTDSDFDILVAGGGNSARLAALALAAAGFRIGLSPHAFAKPKLPPASNPDFFARVLAVSEAACALMARLGVLKYLRAPPVPIKKMLVGAGAPSILGAAGEFAFTPEQDENLAQIISLADLTAALCRAVRDSALVPCAVSTPHPAALLVNAEGAASPLRAAAGFSTRRYAYRHSALVACLTHAVPHEGVARQYFIDGGALACLPLADIDGAAASALIWSQPTELARARHHAPRLAAELTALSGGVLGEMAVKAAPAKQTLHALMAENFVRQSHILIGESAHVVHPMAGQGFNLTVRDIAELVGCLTRARGIGLALNDAAVLDGFARTRRADALRIAALTHGLFHFFAPNAPLAGLRAWGLAQFGGFRGAQDFLRRQAAG